MLVTKIGIGQCTLHKIFRVFNFCRKGHRRKIFNDENFAIYGTQISIAVSHSKHWEGVWQANDTKTALDDCDEQ